MTTHTEPRQAIALKYDGHHAPTLTAKGDEALAEEILRIARESEVPIYENAELVKLLARMELGTASRKSCIARLPKSSPLPGTSRASFPRAMTRMRRASRRM